MLDVDGSTATLSCEAMGGPNNTFLWLREEVVVGNTSSLMIENVTVLESGEYVCIVNNLAGVGMDAVTINGCLSHLFNFRLISVLFLSQLQP